MVGHHILFAHSHLLLEETTHEARRGLSAVSGCWAVLFFSFFVAVPGCGTGDDTGVGQQPSARNDESGPTPTEKPPSTAYLRLWSPADGATVVDPVTFRWRAGSGVGTVSLECDGLRLHPGVLPADQESFTYDFGGVGEEKTLVITGYDDARQSVATDGLRFTPVRTLCPLEGQPEFNGYVIESINDWARYPRDGTYPYCWTGDCGAAWGQIHDGYYASEFLYEGGEDCFCSGHTLELFLRAYQLFQEDHDLPEDTLYSHEDNVLTVDALYLGAFYQYWQGWGVTDYASAADALVSEGIGEELFEEDWDSVWPGDFVNIWRTDGSGHSVIFVDWIEDDGVKVGLRYYGCNTSGETCPDPDDPANQWGISGPSFGEEYFEGAGGRVIEELLFIGRAFLPDTSP